MSHLAGVGAVPAGRHPVDPCLGLVRWHQIASDFFDGVLAEHRQQEGIYGDVLHGLDFFASFFAEAAVRVPRS